MVTRKALSRTTTSQTDATPNSVHDVHNALPVETAQNLVQVKKTSKSTKASTTKESKSTKNSKADFTTSSKTAKLNATKTCTAKTGEVGKSNATENTENDATKVSKVSKTTAAQAGKSGKVGLKAGPHGDNQIDAVKTDAAGGNSADKTAPRKVLRLKRVPKFWSSLAVSELAGPAVMEEHKIENIESLAKTLDKSLEDSLSSQAQQTAAAKVIPVSVSALISDSTPASAGTTGHTMPAQSQQQATLAESYSLDSASASLTQDNEANHDAKLNAKLDDNQVLAEDVVNTWVKTQAAMVPVSERWNFPSNTLGWLLYQQLQTWLDRPTRINLNSVPDWLDKLWALAQEPYFQPEITFTLILQLMGNSKLLKQLDLVVAQRNSEHKLEALVWSGLYATKSFMQRPQLPRSDNRRRYIALSHEMDTAQEHWQKAFDLGFYPASLLLHRLKGYREELDSRLKHGWTDNPDKDIPKISAATIAMFGQPSELNGDEPLDESLDIISHPLALGYHKGYAAAINAINQTLLERYVTKQQGLYLNVLDHFLCTQPAISDLPHQITELLISVKAAYVAHHAALNSSEFEVSAQASAVTQGQSVPKYTKDSADNTRIGTTVEGAVNSAVANDAVTKSAVTTYNERLPWYHLPWLYTLSQRLEHSREIDLNDEQRQNLRLRCLQTLITPALQLLPLIPANRHSKMQPTCARLADTQAANVPLVGTNPVWPKPASIAGQAIDLSIWINQSTGLALINSIAALYDLAEMEIKQLPKLQHPKLAPPSEALAKPEVWSDSSATPKFEDLPKSLQAQIKTAQTHIEYFLLLQSSILGTPKQRALGWSAYQELVETYNLNVKEFLRKLDHNPAASFMLCWLYLSGTASRTDYAAVWAYLNQSYALIAMAQSGISSLQPPQSQYDNHDLSKASVAASAKTTTSAAKASALTAKNQLDIPRGTSFLDSILHTTKKLQEQNNAYFKLLSEFAQSDASSKGEDKAANLTFLGTSALDNTISAEDELKAMYTLEYQEQDEDTSADEAWDIADDKASKALEETSSKVLAESLAQDVSLIQDFALDLFQDSTDASDSSEATAQDSTPDLGLSLDGLRKTSNASRAESRGSSSSGLASRGSSVAAAPGKRILSLRKKSQANQDSHAKLDEPEFIKVNDSSELENSAKFAALSDALAEAEESMTLDDSLSAATLETAANITDNINVIDNAKATGALDGATNASSTCGARGEANTIQATNFSGATQSTETSASRKTASKAASKKNHSKECAQADDIIETFEPTVSAESVKGLAFLQSGLNALPSELQLNGLNIEREQIVALSLAKHATLAEFNAQAVESSANRTTSNSKAPTKSQDSKLTDKPTEIKSTGSQPTGSAKATDGSSTGWANTQAKDSAHGQNQSQAQSPHNPPILAVTLEGWGYTYLLPQIYALQAGLLLRGFGTGQNQRLALAAAEQWGACISEAEVSQALIITKTTSILWSYLDTPDESFIHYVNRLARNGDVAARLIYGLGLAYGIMGRNADLKQGKNWTNIAEKQGAAPQVLNKKLYNFLQQRIKG